MDMGYHLSEGTPKSLVENPLWEQEAQKSLYDEQLRAPANGAGGGGQADPSTQLPLGDPILPLMLMLMAYAGWITVKRRRQKL